MGRVTTREFVIVKIRIIQSDSPIVISTGVNIQSDSLIVFSTQA